MLFVADSVPDPAPPACAPGRLRLRLPRPLHIEHIAFAVARRLSRQQLVPHRRKSHRPPRRARAVDCCAWCPFQGRPGAALPFSAHDQVDTTRRTSEKGSPLLCGRPSFEASVLPTPGPFAVWSSRFVAATTAALALCADLPIRDKPHAEHQPRGGQWVAFKMRRANDLPCGV